MAPSSTFPATGASSRLRLSDPLSPLVPARPLDTVPKKARDATKPAADRRSLFDASAAPKATPHAANADFESVVLERLKRAQERARLLAEAEKDDEE